jgi:hypothetical protein
MPYREHYRQLWVQAGYRGDIGSAAAAMPPSPECRRVFYLTSAEYALSNIVFKRIKVSRLATLNDPFEVLSQIAPSSTFRRRMVELKHQLNAEIGVLSFSSDWTDPVLWAHYGARNSGICLGIDVPKALLKQIDYRTERLQPKEIPEADLTIQNELLIEQLLTTKFASWNYENEFRRIVKLSDTTQEGDLHFLNFAEDLRLGEVIIGPMCHLNHEKVREVAAGANPAVTVYKARLAHNFFKLVPDEATIP